LNHKHKSFWIGIREQKEKVVEGNADSAFFSAENVTPYGENVLTQYCMDCMDLVDKNHKY